jgi:hypothetical protein
MKNPYSPDAQEPKGDRPAIEQWTQSLAKTTGHLTCNVTRFRQGQFVSLHTKHPGLSIQVAQKILLPGFILFFASTYRFRQVS